MFSFRLKTHDGLTLSASSGPFWSDTCGKLAKGSSHQPLEHDGWEPSQPSGEKEKEKVISQLPSSRINNIWGREVSLPHSLTLVRVQCVILSLSGTASCLGLHFSSYFKGPHSDCICCNRNAKATPVTLRRRVNDERREQNAGGWGRSEQMQRRWSYLFILTCSLIASADKPKEPRAQTERTVIRLKDPTDVHLFSSWIQISNLSNKVEVQVFTFKPHNQFSTEGFEYDNLHGQTGKLIFM